MGFTTSKDVTIQIAIPEIGVEELKYHQNEVYVEDLMDLHEKFKKFKKMEGSELKISDINYKDYVDAKLSAYLGKYNIKTISNPNNEVFQKLIKKVVGKEKPFYKKRNGVDSGFKDSVIWESILEFVSQNSYDRYFFLTNDSDFEDDKLEKEFVALTGKELSIVGEVADLKGKLEEEIEGTKNINDSLHEIQENLLDHLKKINSENFLKFKSNIGQYDIVDICGYEILDINSTEREHNISAEIGVKHESMYALYAKHIAFDKNYIDDTDISLVEVSLVFDEDFNLKKISSDNILFNGLSEMSF